MPDLSTWNLTIPQGRPAITISTSQLQRDYRSDYFQRTADGIRFWVPVNGSHTRNSEFPRSELRETAVQRQALQLALRQGRQLAGGDPAHRGGALDPAHDHRPDPQRWQQ
ncbi:hypothetical protein PALA55_03934 [Pseudomonas aeruginosa]|nr:hypothetical protein PALA55_03934 [Pseudomonas aeruginosa]